MAGCSLTLSSDFTLVSGRNTISFDNGDEFGSLSGWFNLSNPTRITIPAGVGLVELSLFAKFVDDTNQENFLFVLKKNGNDAAVFEWDFVRTLVSINFGMFPVKEDDYFEIDIRQYTGSLKDLDSSEFTFFALTPERRDFVSLGLSVDYTTAFAGREDIPYDVRVRDEGELYDTGTNVLTIPADIGHILVSGVGDESLNGSGTDIAIKKNGTILYTFNPSWNDYGVFPAPFPPIPVTSGDEITFEAEMDSTLDKDTHYLNIDLLEGSSTPPNATNSDLGTAVTTVEGYASLTLSAAKSMTAAEDPFEWTSVTTQSGLSLTAPLEKVTAPAGSKLCTVSLSMSDNSATGTYAAGIIYRERGVDSEIMAKTGQHDGDYSTIHASATFTVEPGDEIYSALTATSADVEPTETRMTVVFYG